MTDSLSYEHLLKHRPTQTRSARRVEAILDAAAELLHDAEPEAVTIRDLADRAGVPTGTLYQFFDDKNTVLQSLAVRFLAGMSAVLDAALSDPAAAKSEDWAHTLGRVLDAYAQLIRQHPAIRRLWLSGTLDAATRRLERRTDDALAARLGARISQQTGVPRGTPAQWQTLVALIDGLLRHAFTVDPSGDATALSEGRRAACAYAATILADGEPSPTRGQGAEPARQGQQRTRRRAHPDGPGPVSSGRNDGGGVSAAGARPVFKLGE